MNLNHIKGARRLLTYATRKHAYINRRLSVAGISSSRLIFSFHCVYAAYAPLEWKCPPPRGYGYAISLFYFFIFWSVTAGRLNRWRVNHNCHAQFLGPNKTQLTVERIKLLRRQQSQRSRAYMHTKNSPKKKRKIGSTTF